MGESMAPELRSIRLEGQLCSSYTNTCPAPVPQGRHRVPPKFWVLPEAHSPFCVPHSPFLFPCLCLVDRVKWGLSNGVPWNMTASGKNKTPSFPSWHLDSPTAEPTPCCRVAAAMTAQSHQPRPAQPSPGLLNQRRVSTGITVGTGRLSSAPSTLWLPDSPTWETPPIATHLLLAALGDFRGGCCSKFVLGSNTRWCKGH